MVEEAEMPLPHGLDSFNQVYLFFVSTFVDFCLFQFLCSTFVDCVSRYQLFIIVTRDFVLNLF
jgi:hypothetical protein